MLLSITICDSTADHPVRHTIPAYAVLHGVLTAYRLRCGHIKGFPRLVDILSVPAQYACLFQPPHNLAQVDDPLAIFPVVGARRWHRSSRKYDPMYE